MLCYTYISWLVKLIEAICCVWWIFYRWSWFEPRAEIYLTVKCANLLSEELTIKLGIRQKWIPFGIGYVGTLGRCASQGFCCVYDSVCRAEEFGLALAKCGNPIAALIYGKGQLKCDGTRAETRFRLSAKRTSPFKSAGASVQSTTGSRGVRISGSNAGYTMFRGSVKSTGYPLHSPVSPSLTLPCVTVCHHISTGLYQFASSPPIHQAESSLGSAIWTCLTLSDVHPQ